MGIEEFKAIRSFKARKYSCSEMNKLNTEDDTSNHLERLYALFSICIEIKNFSDEEALTRNF